MVQNTSYNKTLHKKNDLSEAELEATRLAMALQQHKINVENLDRKETNVEMTHSKPEQKKEFKEEEERQFGNVELSLLDGLSDIKINGQS